VGLFFRKSIKFGPFRINLSKSGVGVSAGVKGARISKGPRGTYINVGRGGIYYRQKLDAPHAEATATTSNKWNETAIDVPRGQLLESIKPPPKRSLPTIIHFAYIALTIGAISWVVWYGINHLPYTEEGRNQSARMLFTIPMGVWVAGVLVHHFVSRAYYRPHLHPLYYELDQTSAARFEVIKRACSSLAQSNKVWALPSLPGYSHLMSNAAPVWIGQQQPPLISTNVDVWAMGVSGWRMFFLPDNIYIFQNNSYSTLAYESLRISSGDRRAFMYQAVPPDAQVVDRTWQHTRKDGLPDLRYKYNPMIPIVLCGIIHIRADSGWSLILQTSNLVIAQQFVNQIRSVLPDRYKRASQQPPPQDSQQQSKHREQKRSSSSTQTGTTKSPYEVLGVTPRASLSEITTAYHELARRNHPDKVANLDPEFRELAERRMKAINEAYQELKRRFE
jgi:hypothetical protein